MAGSKLSKFDPPRPSVYTPFRRWFGDEGGRELDEFRALYEQVRRAHLASRWHDENMLGETAGQIIRAVRKDLGRSLSEPMVRALADVLIEILMLETHIFMTPTIDWNKANFSAAEFVELRQFLRRQQHFLDNQERIGTLLSETLTLIFASILRPLSALAEQSRFSVPLHAMLGDLNETVDKTIGTIISEHRIDAGLFSQLAETIYSNICAVSGVRPDQEISKPLLTADVSPLRDRDLLDVYLDNTPLLPFLTTAVPFALTRHKAHHWAVYGRTGHGKTQLLQALILEHLQEEEPQALIVIDSQGREGMLRKFEELEIFARDPDRLLVIDAEATPAPALNMFDVPRLDEAAEIEVVDLYTYIFSAIDADLTSRQSTAFSYIVRLMLAHPGATIMTLLELMEERVKSAEQSKFWPTIKTLDTVAQNYFANRFFTSATNQTKEQLAVRLYGLLRIKAIGRMFTAPENKLNLFQAMQDKKVVLISTAGLGEASSLFGRYMIALAMRAAFQRATVPESKRHPVLLFVDEAFDLMDSNINRILIQARKYGLFLRYATQQYEQISHDIRAAAAANTEVKLTGGLSASDCRTLAPDMRTTPEFLMGMTRVDRKYTEFACFVQNITPAALKLEVPFGVLEAAPRMDPANYEALRRGNRERFGTSGIVPPKPTVHPHDTTVTLVDYGTTHPCVLDSGAYMTVFPATDLVVENGVASFKLLGTAITGPVIRHVGLIGFSGEALRCPVIQLRIRVGAHEALEDCALNLPGTTLLIGRTFMAGRILVEPKDTRW